MRRPGGVNKPGQPRSELDSERRTTNDCGRGVMEYREPDNEDDRRRRVATCTTSQLTFTPAASPESPLRPRSGRCLPGCQGSVHTVLAILAFSFVAGSCGYEKNSQPGHEIKKEVREEFHGNRRIKSRIHLIGGQRHGDFEVWGDDGGILIRGWYEDDLAAGKWRTYQEGGAIKSTTIYVDGKKHGLHEEFKPSGQVSKSGTYDAGARTGMWLFEGDGEATTCNYLNDLPDDCVTTYTSGAVRMTVNYDAGVPDGRIIEFSETGSRIAEYTYVEGERHGAFVFNHDNGKRLSSGKYVEGGLHGLVLVYGEKGQFVAAKCFKMDTLLWSSSNRKQAERRACP